MENPRGKSSTTPPATPPVELASERELSKQQALKNAQAARDAHRSHKPGVDDDSEAIQGWAATLAAPIEGAADALPENERTRVRGQDAAANEGTGPRATDAPNVTDDGRRRAQPPTRSEDAEWDPLKATAEHRSNERR